METKKKNTRNTIVTSHLSVNDLLLFGDTVTLSLFHGSQNGLCLLKNK